MPHALEIAFVQSLKVSRASWAVQLDGRHAFKHPSCHLIGDVRRGRMASASGEDQLANRVRVKAIRSMTAAPFILRT